MSTAVGVWAIDSRRGLLAGSALLDLVARLPEDILAPILSITGGSVGKPTLGLLTTWIMLTVAMYTFAPLAYSYLEMLPRDAPGFRAIFAAGSISFGICLEYLNSVSARSVALFFIVSLCIVVFLGYLHSHRDWSLLDPDGRAVDMLQFLTPHEDVRDEIEDDLSYQGGLGVAARGSYLVAIGMVLTFPAILAAFATQILIYAYPVPDIVFLGWAISVRVLPQLSAGPNRDRILTLEFDFERFLIDTLENATRSFQGMFLTVFIICGLFNSAGYLFVGINLLPSVVEAFSRGLGLVVEAPTVEGVRILWNLAGLVFLLGFAGCYAIWAWVRELGRLPSFLDEWESRDTSTGGSETTRPPGLVMIPVSGLVLVALFVHLESALIASIFAVFWPLLIIAGTWTVRITQRRVGQSARVEHWWIAGGLLAQTWALWLATSLPNLISSVRGEQPLSGVLALPLVVTGLILVVMCVPIVNRYENQSDSEHTFLFPGLLFVIGAVASWSHVALPPRFGELTTALAVLTFVFGVLLGVVRYYDL